MSNDIFHEVENDLRQQKIHAFWKENGAWIIGGCVGAIFLTAGIGLWRNYDAHSNTAATTALGAVMADTDTAQLVTFADDAGGNHALFALFAAARHAAQAGQHAEAANLFDKAAATRADGIYKQLAALYSINQKLAAGDDAQTLHAQLDKLATAQSPWRFTARELRALLYAREGQADQAVQTYAALEADPKTPPALRQRAGMMRAFYAATPNDKG